MSTGRAGSVTAKYGQFLYQALAEPIGLLLRTSDVPRARTRLYAARKALADPALAGLQIRMSPLPEGDIIIVKGGAASAQGDQET